MKEIQLCKFFRIKGGGEGRWVGLWRPKLGYLKFICTPCLEHYNSTERGLAKKTHLGGTWYKGLKLRLYVVFNFLMIWPNSRLYHSNDLLYSKLLQVTSNPGLLSVINTYYVVLWEWNNIYFLTQWCGIAGRSFEKQWHAQTDALRGIIWGL